MLLYAHIYIYNSFFLYLLEKYEIPINKDRVQVAIGVVRDLENMAKALSKYSHYQCIKKRVG